MPRGCKARPAVQGAPARRPSRPLPTPWRMSCAAPAGATKRTGVSSCPGLRSFPCAAQSAVLGCLGQHTLSLPRAWAESARTWSTSTASSSWARSSRTPRAARPARSARTGSVSGSRQKVSCSVTMAAAAPPTEPSSAPASRHSSRTASRGVLRLAGRRAVSTGSTSPGGGGSTARRSRANRCFGVNQSEGGKPLERRGGGGLLLLPSPYDRPGLLFAYAALLRAGSTQIALRFSPGLLLGCTLWRIMPLAGCR